MINAIGRKMSAGQVLFALLLTLGFIAGYFGVIIAFVDLHLPTWVRWLDGLDGLYLLIATVYIMRKENILP